MRTYDEALEASLDEHTFSNSTQWEIWSYNWCERCIHDKPARHDHPERGCPLIMVSLMGRRPVEWLTETEEQEVLADYHCIEFRDERDGPGGPPRPKRTPPGQGELLPRESVQGVRLLSTGSIQPSQEAAISGSSTISRGR